MLAAAMAMVSCTKGTPDTPREEEKEDEPQVETIAVQSVSLSAESLNLWTGADRVLTATVLPENATNRKVTWTSSNGSVATVSGGKVSCLGEGTAVVSVTTEDGHKTAVCTVAVLNLPAEVLPGEFSVSPTRKVYFTKANMYWNGSSYQFEERQYDYRHYNGMIEDGAAINGVKIPTPAGTVGSFHWIPNADPSCNPYDSLYTGPQTFPTIYPRKTLFTNATDSTANPNFTVGGVQGLYRTLSVEEIRYLVARDDSSRVGRASIAEIRGFVLIPDTFVDPKKNGGNKAFTPMKSREDNVYAAGEDWAAMEAAGAVFLPCAGLREHDQDNVRAYYVGLMGNYWMSGANTGAHYIRFYAQHYSDNPIPEIGTTCYVRYGSSIRLVLNAER